MSKLLSTVPSDDPVLAPLLERAQGDPDALGILLHGSRGASMEDDLSDYDLVWIMTDEEYERRAAEGRVAPEVTFREGHKHIELAYSSPECLLDPEVPDWYIRGFATARILVDTDGAVERLLSTLLTISEEEARTETALLFGGYLNGFYRSMKASRRGNELGARLHAAESLTYLVQALFTMERRWPPFLDRLSVAVSGLAAQGWAQGELEDSFLGILRRADPHLQQSLEERVERLMRDRGYGGVIDEWEGEIERVKSF